MLNTDKSNALYAKACELIPSGVSSSMRKNVKPTLYFDRADGAYFYDVDENRYLDYTLAWGPLIAGSNNTSINHAVREQLNKSYTLGAQHRLEIDLAGRLVSVLPGVEQITFSNTGNEAVQSAIRMARAYTGRDKIIKFEGHYHGWSNNILVSYKPSQDQLGTPAAACGGQPDEEFSHTMVLPWNDLDAAEREFAKYPGEIACLITEPILANSGSCMPEAGYLQGLIELCHRYGAVSIVDEVITGFRIAMGGAREYFGIDPDMSIYGKAIAGGFTLAAIAGKKEIFDVLRDGRTIHAGTYNGSSINLAASMGTLDVLSAHDCFERMNNHGNHIREHIESLGLANDIPLATTGVGTVFSVHFGVPQPPKSYRETLLTDMKTYDRFRMALLESGVQVLPDGRWYCGATHTEDDLAFCLKSIEKAFDDLKEVRS